MRNLIARGRLGRLPHSATGFADYSPTGGFQPGSRRLARRPISSDYNHWENLQVGQEMFHLTGSLQVPALPRASTTPRAKITVVKIEEPDAVPAANTVKTEPIDVASIKIEVVDEAPNDSFALDPTALAAIDPLSASLDYQVHWI